MSRRALCSNFNGLGKSRLPLPHGSYPTLNASSTDRRRLLSVCTVVRNTRPPTLRAPQKVCRHLSTSTRASQKVAQISSKPSNQRTGQGTAFSRKLFAVSTVIAIASVIAGTLVVDPIGALIDDTSLARFIIRLRRGKPMNEDTFVPFVVTSKEQISSTSFIITIRPQSSTGSTAERKSRPQIHDLHSNKAVLWQAWEHGLWSVEIKQPQLQIARNYTPLPPRKGEEDNELDSGALRFFFRKYDGGEVSTYLSRLSVGDTVELRGPHLGFDLRKRLGDAQRLVFLAGGTGIAPALQAVHLLHKYDGASHGSRSPHISILWANRRREDCVVDDTSSHTGNIIIQQLHEMKRESPGLMDIKYVVDEERAYIGASDISKLTSTGVMKQEASAVPASFDSCFYHSERLIESTADGDPVTQADCPCQLQSSSGRVGKNIVIVSGPDGFIQHYAGPKRWASGGELQGPVLGLIGQLKRKYPAIWKDWIVLKL